MSKWLTKDGVSKTNTTSKTLTTLHLTDDLFTTSKTQPTNFNFEQTQHKYWPTSNIWIETTRHLIPTTTYTWHYWLITTSTNQVNTYAWHLPVLLDLCINKGYVFTKKKNYQHFSVELRDCRWHYLQATTDFCPVSCTKIWQSTETAQATNRCKD